MNGSRKTRGGDGEDDSNGRCAPPLRLRRPIEPKPRLHSTTSVPPLVTYRSFLRAARQSLADS